MPINVVCLAQRPAAMSLGSHTRCIPIRPQKVVLENGRESIHHVQSPCIACKLSGIRKECVTGCPDCDPPVHLHVGDCFERYHRKMLDGSWEPQNTRKRRKTATKGQRVNARRPTGRT